MKNTKMTRKELFHILFILALWAFAGFVVGWCMVVFQQHSHPDELPAFAEVRSAGNLLIGSIAGLLIGVVKIARG